MFIQNAWYVAATTDEIADKPVGRTLCGKPMVMFRDANGQLACVDDFCPHRGLPLSMGYVENGELVCGYHGLRMGADGQVASMPKQRVQNFPCNQRYPVIERHGFVWVWPGQPDRASADALPAFKWSDQSEWAHGGGVFNVRSDYRLMIDNLMDLTHENYVHASSIGQKEIDEQPVRTRRDGDQVVTSRLMEGVTAPPFWQMAMEQQGLDPTALVDRWQVCRFQAPSHIMIDVGVALAGQGGIDAPNAAKTHAVVTDFITPETATSHWYFWGMARSWAIDDDTVTDRIRDGQGGIFSEDLAVLEAQQRSLLAHPDRQLLKLDIDAGGIQARRMIEQALAAAS